MQFQMSCVLCDLWYLHQLHISKGSLHLFVVWILQHGVKESPHLDLSRLDQHHASRILETNTQEYIFLKQYHVKSFHRRTEGEESQGEKSSEESTGDTINRDISDCSFTTTSEDNSANNNDDNRNESGGETSSEDDTRDWGPYEATKVHFTDSQDERDRQDEHVLNLHYPEIFWCSWCNRPNSIVNDVPIGCRPRRVSIETSEEELALQNDENLMVFPVNYDEHDVAIAKNVNDGLPSYNEVFAERIPEGQFRHVKAPLSYSPINATI